MILSPFAEPAVNEILAEPLPGVAVNDVGAPGAVAENEALQVADGSKLFQLLSE